MSEPASDSAPVSPPFHQRIIAAPEEIDELGHASNIAYVRWLQEVAKAHSRAIGWDHAAYVEAGAVFVVRRHEIEYLAPVYVGDELLVVTWLEGWTKVTSDRRTRIERPRDGREVARARTLWAFVAMDTGRPRRIPAEMVEAFARPVS